MSDSFNTTPDNWPGIDNVPTAGSENLVKSGGVKEEFNKLISDFGIDFDINTNFVQALLTAVGAVTTYGSSAGSNRVSDYIKIKAGDAITGLFGNGVSTFADACFYDTSKTFHSSIKSNTVISGFNVFVSPIDGYVRVMTNIDVNPLLSIQYRTAEHKYTDETPTVNSNKLVNSGNIARLFLNDVPIKTTWEDGKIMNSSGYIINMSGWSVSDSFILDEGVTITGVFGETNPGYSVCAFFDEGEDRAFQRFTGTGEEQAFTVPKRCYVRISVNDSVNPTRSFILPDGGFIDLKALSDDVEYIKEHSGVKKSIWEGKKVGFLGDSTSTSGTSTYVENYVALTGCLSQNYAIGGTSVADNGQPNPMCTRYLALPADLDMVLILGGVNDHRIGIPLGNFEDFNNDGSLNGTFYGALHTLIRGLKVKYLGKPIVYMTPMHNNYMDNTYGDTGEYNYNQLQLGKLVENKFPLNNGNVDETTATGGTLSEYILAIKKVCSFYGVPVIDLHDICGIQPIIPANKTQYLPDGIHPTTQAGGKRMAEAVYPYLEQIYQ